MKTSLSKLALMGIISGLVLVMPIFSAHALSITVDTNSKTETTNTSDGSVEAAKGKATGFWNKTKAWSNRTYNKLDAWRLSQLDIWKAIKAEKEAQISGTATQLDENRDTRVDKVLNEEQVSLYNGAGKDLGGNGHLFLLKLYSFVIFIFIIILGSKIIFYGGILVIILAVIFKLYNMVRSPRQF